MNVLVTAISGNVGNGILKCMQESGQRLFGSDISDFPVGADKVEKCFKVPFAKDKDYISTLFDICDTHNIDVLIPVNEEEIKKVSEARNLFYDRKVKLMIQDETILQICMDKYDLSKYLASNSIVAPETFLSNNFAPDGREYIAKLRNSSGSKIVEKFNTEKELEEILKMSDNEFIIQEYIPSSDSEYTVGVFSDGKTVRSMIFRRKLLNGYTNYVELIKDDSISELAEKVARFLNLRGCINIQLRKNNNQNYIFEINPRISGTVFFRHLLGFTDVLWWMQYIKNDPIERYELLYNKAIGVREMTEKYLLLSPH
ncbi:hypothetical protein FACS189450_10080 [Spirochaetia bacterium]|nr:hypothetical protein FACS189450_10080 [Spirochaetia bacterium]